jgi:hypothetical protein
MRPSYDHRGRINYKASRREQVIWWVQVLLLILACILAAALEPVVVSCLEYVISRFNYTPAERYLEFIVNQKGIYILTALLLWSIACLSFRIWLRGRNPK